MNPIKIDIPSAEEARRRVDQGLYEKAQQQAVEVKKAIDQAISNGEKRVSGDGSLEKPVVTLLESFGYKYTTSVQYNQGCWTISWE